MSYRPRQKKLRSAPPYQGVCFDLDGVLIDTMRLHVRAWQQAAAAFGVQAAAREIYLWEGESGRVTARTLLRRTGVSGSVLTRRMAALLQEKERRFQHLARQQRITVHRPLTNQVRALRQLGTRLGLVTGTSAQEVKHMVPQAVLRQFHVIVTGDAVRHGKPHPEPYRTAFRRLRLPADSCAVVENAPYGIRSARRAGAGFVIGWSTSLPKRYLHEADRVVSTATQLIALLNQLTTAPIRKLTRLRRRRYNTSTGRPICNIVDGSQGS